jgi:tetratricopeptide (TPR) repeat protein
LLCNKGIDDASLTLCDEVLCRLPMTAWANRRKGLILASQGKCSDAIPFLHASIRQNPKDAVVWEAVAACYKRLQRFSAAQKSFQKALKLDPSRPFSLVQHGNILLRDERPLEALECFRNSLTINPECTLSLFGAAKSLKASAKERMSVGAVKAAVHELDAAIAYAIKIVSKKSSLITAFKLLGDLLRQRAEVSTCDRNGAKYLSGEKAKQWRERTNYVRQSRRAYIKALHLCPESASAWQDVAGCLFHDFQIQKSQDTVDALQKEAAVAVLELRKKSEWMLRGGLRLDPESPGMWSTLGVVSTKPSAQEYALSRSLQLDPSNPVAWVALAKMYLEAQEFELAEKCLQQGRAQVPTSGLIWEMMAILAAAQGDPVRAAELAEHAVGLGGGPTSLLMFAQSLIKRGKGDRGEVFVAVRRAAELCPFDPAALNALGLACEARGDKQQALNAYNAALHSLILEDTLKTEDGSSQADFVNYNIARVLVTVGRDAEALETYQRCFENNFTKVGHHSRPLSLVLDAIARLGVGDNQVAIDNLTTLLTLDGKDSLLPDPVKAAAIKVLMRAYDAMGRGDLVFDQVLSPYLSFSSAQNSIVKELLETAIKIVGSSSNGARRSMSGKEVLRLVSRHLPYDADYVGTFLYSWAVHSLKKDAKDSELSISGYCKAVHACPWSPELRTDLGNVSLRKSPYYAVNVLKFLNFPSFGVQVHAFSMANLDAALRLAFFASALVGPAPSKSIHAHMEFILGSIAQALRACPWDDDKWYMGSILATQLAGATGLQEPGSSPAWRRALSWCRGALGILNKSGTVAAALHRRSRLLICMSECTLALIRLSPLRAPGMPPLVADNQEALQLAELALQLAPSLEHRGDALRQIGRCYYHYGDLRNAEEAYKKSLAMDEKNVFGALELGRILEIKGDSASAIELLKQTASQLERFVLMPTEFLVNSAERKRHEALLELLVLNCCLALVRSGKYDEAKALLSKGRPKEAGIDPLFGSRAVVLGAIALQQARKLLSTNEVQGRAFLGEARQALGKALHPGNDATLIRILMSVLEYTGNYRKKAERIAGHAVKAIELCERPIPVYVLLILAEVSGEIIYRAKARHLVPWMSEMW